MSENNIAAKVDQLFAHKDSVKSLEDQIKTHKQAIEELDKDLIAHMESQNMKRFTDKSGRTVFTKKPSLYARIDKEHLDEALEYIKSTWKMPEFVKENISTQTLSRIVREKIEANEPIPEHLFPYYLKTSLGIKRNDS